MNRSAVVADAWARAWRETPCDIYGENILVAKLPGYRRPTYRERLDRPPRNVLGEPIPRIVVVRNNIARLGRCKPVLP